MRFPARAPRAALSILLAAAACEKSKPVANPASEIVPAGVPALDLASNPQILFELFGDADSPRLMPVAAVAAGVIRPIGLTPAGWAQLNARYMAPGSKYSFYLESGDPAELVIERDTAYALPGCRAVKPMALVRLVFRTPRTDSTVEFLASSGPLMPRHPENVRRMTPSAVAALARRLGHEVGKRAGIAPATLDALDFHARLINTGASASPTVLISFIDPDAGDANHSPTTAHVFALADRGPNGYHVTYAHAVKGDARAVEFQRLVNHVDINGSGTDEIILEAWKFGSGSDLVVLTFSGGRWREALRSKQDWCLDLPARTTK